MFDYYYGKNAEQFTFYRIPKALFTEKIFGRISCEAKVLYGLMLDRMGLSVKSHWVDQENRVYIIFPVGEIAELLGCCVQKVAKLLDELDEKRGIGLIERKRLGLGKPNRIYVKNFSLEAQENREEKIFHAELEEEADREWEESLKGQVCKSQNYENHNSRVMDFINPEFQKAEIQNYENHKPGIMKNRNPELWFSQTNKTNNIKTDSNDTEKQTNIDSIYPSIYPGADGSQDMVKEGNLPVGQETGEPSEAGTSVSSLDKKRAFIKQEISYDNFCADFREDRSKLRQVDEVVELIAEVLSLPPEKEMRIGTERMNAGRIQERLRKLRYEHISYVLECLEQVSRTQKIRNVHAYLLTALYRAPMTIQTYYANRAIFDMEQLSKDCKSS